jgi:hypothetical protein
MNRHARRAAAARARRTGYLHRLLAPGALPATVGIHFASIEHDARCSIYAGRGCDCVPDISLSGPDGVTVIDERGQGTKRARS